MVKFDNVPSNENHMVRPVLSQSTLTEVDDVEISSRFALMAEKSDAVHKKIFIDVPSTLHSYCKKRLRYVAEHMKITSAEIKTLTFFILL